MLFRSYLGYVPKINFDRGMELFTSWVNGQEVMEDKFEDSVREMKSKGLFK